MGRCSNREVCTAGHRQAGGNRSHCHVYVYPSVVITRTCIGRSHAAIWSMVEGGGRCNADQIFKMAKYVFDGYGIELRIAFILKFYMTHFDL